MFVIVLPPQRLLESRESKPLWGLCRRGRGRMRKKSDTNPMNASPRCAATSKRTRQRCRAPAVKGWNVCLGDPFRARPGKVAAALAGKVAAVDTLASRSAGPAVTSFCHESVLYFLLIKEEGAGANASAVGSCLGSSGRGPTATVHVATSRVRWLFMLLLLLSGKIQSSHPYVARNECLPFPNKSSRPMSRPRSQRRIPNGVQTRGVA